MRCLNGKRSESHVHLFATPWTVACQAPLSMEFFSKNIGVGIPVSSPGDLPNPGIKPRSPTLQVDSLLSEPKLKPPLKSSLSCLCGCYMLQYVVSALRDTSCSRQRASAANKSFPNMNQSTGHLGRLAESRF